MVSVGQELGRGLAGCFCLKMAQKVAVKMLVWAAVTSGFPWAGKLVLVLAEGLSFSLRGRLHRAAQPASGWRSDMSSPRASDPRQQGRSVDSPTLSFPQSPPITQVHLCGVGGN